MEDAEPTKTQQGFLLVSHIEGWNKAVPFPNVIYFTSTRQ